MFNSYVHQIMYRVTLSYMLLPLKVLSYIAVALPNYNLFLNNWKYLEEEIFLLPVLIPVLFLPLEVQ